MPVTPNQVLADPEFQKFTPDQKIQILTRIDPEFAKFTPERQQQIVTFVRRVPDVPGAIPPGQMRATTPLGVAKSTASKAGVDLANWFSNWVRNNLDVIGGTMGGLLGTPGGPIGAMAGATLGGAAGRAGTQLSRFAEPRPMRSTGEALLDIIGGGTEQGLLEGVGGLVAKGAKMMAPGAGAALRSPA